MNTEALHSETVVKPIKKTKRRLVSLCDIDIIPLKTTLIRRIVVLESWKYEKS